MIYITKKPKHGVKNSEEILNPEPHKSNEERIIKLNGAKLETVKLNPTDTLTKDFRGFWCVNGDTYYNPKYYQIITSDNSVKDELKALTTMDLLKKKLNTLNTQYQQYTDAELHKDQDTQYLKGKAIKKSRCIISKYLSQLKADTNFNINTIGETCYKMVYSGDYVNATKRGNILVKGVF